MGRVALQAAHAALLVVDAQEDYFAREGLSPNRGDLEARIRALIVGWRRAGLPVVHVRTRVSRSGADAMPHRVGQPLCVDGTPGAEPPPGLAELPSETIIAKQYFRAAGDEHVRTVLERAGVTTVVVAGLYTHACVREAVVDCYEAGFPVVVPVDAVGSDQPEHAALTLQWLDGRAARLSSVTEILSEVEGSAARAVRVAARTAPTAERSAGAAVAIAVERARRAHVEWSMTPLGVRRELLDRWSVELERNRDALAALIASEVSKPITLARDELQRAVAHVRAASGLAENLRADRWIAPGVRSRRTPLGVVAAIMPWNNPIALAIGKIAPALVCGNAVVLKPAPEGSACAHALLDSLVTAGMPDGLVVVVDGGAETGALLVAAPEVDGVTVTGSIRTGRAIVERCTRRGRPVQAELGGNNAAIVTPDVDLATVVPLLLRNAYAYAGQRCTALRRFIVLDDCLERFLEHAVDALRDLQPGDVADPDVLIGPLVSVGAAERVLQTVETAQAEGARIIAGGGRTSVHPAALTPALVLARDPRIRIVQEETFGPVAVIQPATDIEEAIELANGVDQGLLMAVCTADPELRARIAARARVGILQFGAEPVPVHPLAPFAGWKHSGYGPPEHGEWDLDFFTRTQAVYGDVEGAEPTASS